MSSKPPKNKPKRLRNGLILTGIGFQMGITIYLFIWLGKWLDANYNQGEKLYVIIMTLAGVGVSLYAVVKQLNRFNNT
ncbi:AtpZ/AtpI family protein [Flavobacteriaceae bacterium S356]|uniref:AtpZ/AtpI family protein n=1 Tax=Asprobacillus argus TaxID=3076534 RepID=A0ABU3LC85_9FLAO|nr:AtpZ/AtpI family protein [Flavobacteriaceae bacterium S356]